MSKYQDCMYIHQTWVKEYLQLVLCFGCLLWGFFFFNCLKYHATGGVAVPVSILVVVYIRLSLWKFNTQLRAQFDKCACSGFIITFKHYTEKYSKIQTGNIFMYIYTYCIHSWVMFAILSAQLFPLWLIPTISSLFSALLYLMFQAQTCASFKCQRLGINLLV